MKITHDMLLQKCVSSDLIDDFDGYFLNGFDFSNTYEIPDYFIEDVIVIIAGLFSYTGLFQSFDEDDKTNLFQLNFVNGYLENPSKYKPAYIIYNTYYLSPLVMEFYNKGKLNNPDKDKPSTITWHKGGKIESREFSNFDKYNDPFPGIPALAWYYEDGKIEQIAHYKDDLLHNPDPNIPAVVIYRDDGSIDSVQYFENDELNDPPNGNAALATYDRNGKICYEYHYKHGILQ